MPVLNQLAKECHAANRHWWTDPSTGKWVGGNRFEKIMLIVSEISEAMEGERKSLMDDHLPHRRMPEVELADAMIRIFDYAGAFKHDLDQHVPAHTSLNDLAAQCADRVVHPAPTNKSEALLELVEAAVLLSQIEDGRKHNRTPDEGVANLICYVTGYAGQHGYDLDGAVAEKRAYNAHRADHKPEARMAAGGKRW